MKTSLLAPQYGLGRAAHSDLEEWAVDTETVPSAPQAEPSSGPKVTFKRRRQVDFTAVADAAASKLAEPAQPRVYRLESPTTAHSLPAPAPSPQASVGDAASPAGGKQGRRRDAATRRPKLLSHVVFSQTPEGAPCDSQAVGAGTAPIGTRALRDALARLDATLDSIAHAQEAFRALDHLLTSLGVGAAPERPRRARRAAHAPAAHAIGGDAEQHAPAE